MAIEFFKTGNKLILRYIPDVGGDWIDREFEKNAPNITIKKTFRFSKSALMNKVSDSLELSFGAEFVYDFHFATKVDNMYYKVRKEVLSDSMNIYISSDVNVKEDYFVTDLKVSIFKVMSDLTTNDFYIGGSHPTAIAVEIYEDIIGQFPSYYERIKYTEARVASVLRNYLDGVKDAENNYNLYLNKKVKAFPSNFGEQFTEYEIRKYRQILERLEKLLASKNAYTERQWQEEILNIILLIYPKYIHVFREVQIKKYFAGAIGRKFLDFLLIDSNGNVDILEIKKPFENAIITKDKYRDNHIPLRELSGTVMQIEKYIYYLNRWGIEGEDKLTKKYKNELPVDFKINITNPSGIIIMGRDIGLTREQKMDFEVVKRKYKNIVDIITYDDLLKRLKFIIEQMVKKV